MKMHNNLRKYRLYFFFIFTTLFKKATQEMEFRIDVVTGIVISASLWLVTDQQNPNKVKVCNRLTDMIDPCGCSLSQASFDLLCASDGQTYLSMCYLNCQMAKEKVKISVVHKGICTVNSECKCQERYEPLCASNGVTYPNECVLICFMDRDSTIRFKHAGTCESGGREPQDVPENEKEKPGDCCCTCCHRNLRRLRTRFGNNGKRYARSSCGCGCRHERNTEAPQKPPPAKLTAQPPSCPFNNPQLRTSQGCPNQPPACPLTDEEKKPKTKKCVCAMLHRPVCSNHNTTYANFCVLECITRRNPSVDFQHWGVCGKPQKTPYGDN